MLLNMLLKMLLKIKMILNVEMLKNIGFKGFETVRMILSLYLINQCNMSENSKFKHKHSSIQAFKKSIFIIKNTFIVSKVKIDVLIIDIKLCNSGLV